MWGPEKNTEKQFYFYFFKKSIFTKNRFKKHLTWHHVTSWCESACGDLQKKFETIWNVTSCDVIHVGTWEQKNFECYHGDITFQLTLSKRCNVHAMSMPWNVIKVTLHSSSHYPSDAMSMQCPCHGMLSGWHYILAHITQAMRCPCNVHAMECYQGDIKF
jgi:hypothetical protein